MNGFADRCLRMFRLSRLSRTVPLILGAFVLGVNSTPAVDCQDSHSICPCDIPDPQTNELCAECNAPQIILISGPEIITRSNIEAAEFRWVGYSTCGDCIQWGPGAEFVLDGGIAPAPHDPYVTPILGGTGVSGQEIVSHMQISNIFEFKCRHTMKIRAVVRQEGTNCDNPQYAVVESNSIDVWIDGDETSPEPTVENNMQTCGDSPPKCDEVKGLPVDLVSGDMHYEKTDLRIAGPLPIEFTRRYFSKSPADGDVGFGWQHNFMIRLSDVDNEAMQTFVGEDMLPVTFSCSDGNEVAQTCNGQWSRNEQRQLSLLQGTDPPWRIKDNHGLKFDFDEQGRLQSVRDRNQNRLVLEYDGSPERLKWITDDFDRQIELDYDGNGRLATITADDRTVTFTYTDGNLTRVDYPDDRSLTYEYDSPHGDHLLTGVRDANDKVIESHEFYSDGQHVEHTLSAEGSWEFLYGSADSTTRTVTDFRGEETEYTIDTVKGVATLIDGPGCISCGGGVSTTKVFDGRLNVTSSTDADNVETTTTYDDRNNVLTRTEALGVTGLARTTTYAYENDFWDFPTTISVDSVGDEECALEDKTTTRDYDDATGNLMSEEIEGCNGAEVITQATEYTYDSHGQIATITGPLVSQETAYEYYADNDATVNLRGRLHRVTNSLGHETTYSNYDYFGNAGVVTDPNGVVTMRTFNANDQVTMARIEGATDAEDIETQYDYDDAGNLFRLLLPRCVALNLDENEEEGCDSSFEYHYDEMNRLDEVQDAFGNKIQYLYDTAGNRIREAYVDSGDVARRATHFEYDDFDRLERVCLSPPEPDPPNELECGSVFSQTAYNPDGTKLSEVDPEGHITEFEYDKLKRVKFVTQTIGLEEFTAEYVYDSQDNLIRVIDPRGLETTYEVGDLGWRLSTESPDTGTAIYSYDGAGNLTSITDARGPNFTVTREYDALNRLTGIGHATRTDLNMSYFYDETWVSNGIGRRTGMVDSAGQSAFYYDSRGLLTHDYRVAYGLYTEMGYDYDKNGNLAELRYPAIGNRQNRVKYTYDDADRVDLVTTELEYQTTTVAEDFQYLPFGPRSEMRFGSDLLDTRTFDARYQLDRWRLGEGLIDYIHTFDDDGNLTGRTDQGDSSNDRAFGYDALHRLTLAEGPWGAYTGCPGDQTYTYDHNGNRQCKDETGEPVDYFYFTGTNRLESTEIDEEELASYSYDANGNTTADEMHTYEYNEANRLEMVDAGATYYAYDGDHRRAVKATEDLTYYFFDPSGRLLTEVRVDDELNRFVAKDYIYVHGAPVARVDWLMNQGFGGFGSMSSSLATWSDSLFFYHTDHLGTPVMMTSGSSVPVWKAEHLPFGELFSNTTADIENNLRFPGQYFDSETALHQNGFRDYNAQIGRYVEPDPLGVGVSPNLFAYVAGNPLSNIDLLGLATERACRLQMCCRPIVVAQSWVGRFINNSTGNQANHCFVRMFVGQDTTVRTWSLENRGGTGVAAVNHPEDQYYQGPKECGPSGCADPSILDCLDRTTSNEPRRPYQTLGQNSNTFARKLSSCGVAPSPLGNELNAPGWNHGTWQ